MSSKRQFFLLVVALGVAGRAAAQEAPETSVDAKADEAVPVMEQPVPSPAPAVSFDVGPLPIEFHGYASQGYVLSDHNNYYAYNSNKGSFRMTEVALNATSQLTDRLRVVVQMASVINDDFQSPQVRLDFGFVDYRWFDALGFRVGRFRLLSQLYTEVWDTDIARVPIFLPQGVYDPLGRVFFMNGDGVQAYGALRSQHAGTIDYAVSLGTILPFQLQGSSVDVRIVTAGRVIYTTPFSGLRLGGTWNFSDGSSTLPSSVTQGLIAAGALPPTFSGNVSQHFDAFYRCGAFAELTLGDWQLSAEFIRMYANIRTDGAALAQLIPTSPLRQEGGYLMTNYRFTDWFTAGAYASFYWPDYTHRDWHVATTHAFDYAATLRFDINSYLALKTEVHRINGTGALNPDINSGGGSNNGWLFAARVSAAF